VRLTGDDPFLCALEAACHFILTHFFFRPLRLFPDRMVALSIAGVSILWWAVGALVLYFLYRIRARSIPGIGSPEWVPFIGNLITVKKNFDRLYDWNEEVSSEEHGDKYGLRDKPYCMSLLNGYGRRPRPLASLLLVC
jgi:hypothetical protein